jgi:hypothetical protein
VHAVGTGGGPGDTGGCLDWVAGVVCQPVCPNLVYARVCLCIQDLLSLDLDLALGAAKRLLVLGDFPEL